jgi:hypothetical protein
VKCTIARTLEKGRPSIFEEGRKEGLAQEQNNMLMEIALTQDVVSIPAASETQTTYKTADFGTQTTLATTANTVTQTTPDNETAAGLTSPLTMLA